MKRIFLSFACVLTLGLSSVASYAQTYGWKPVDNSKYLSSELHGAYGQETAANASGTISEEAQGVFNDAEENADDEDEDDSSKFLSGSVVGVWRDGFCRGTSAMQLDQVWLTSERAIDTEARPVDFGYRVDAVFGVVNGQCCGDGGFDGKWGVSGDGYGASIYQAYGEIGVDKLSFKAGKFETLVGYEPTDVSQMNFNTCSYLCSYEPGTHTGGLFSYQATDKFSVDFGLVSGADCSFENRRGDTGFLFGASWQATDDFSIGYASLLCQDHSEPGEDRVGLSYGYYDDLGGVSVGDTDEYLQTFVVDWNLSDKLNYAFATNYGSMADRAEHRARYGLFGFANYLNYSLTDKLTSALRYEYFTERLEEAGRTPENDADELRCHELSYGLVYRPREQIFIRPEVRYDRTELAEKSDGFTGSVGFGATF